MLVDQLLNDNHTAPAPMVKCHARQNAQPVCFVSVFQAQALNNDAWVRKTHNVEHSEIHMCPPLTVQETVFMA